MKIDPNLNHIDQLTKTTTTTKKNRIFKDYKLRLNNILGS